MKICIRSFRSAIAVVTCFLGMVTRVQALTTPSTGAIASGGAHAVALKSDGTVWTWGASNANGELGNGTTVPQAVPAPVSGMSSMVAVAAGSSHTVALKSDGTVWAWGANSSGQLGDGTTTQRTTPVQVSGLTGVVAVAAGSFHTVALKSDGTVWAWGYNASGQLGDGTTTQRTTPVQVSGLSGVVVVAGGDSHTVALKSDGTMWAWGNNASGQLGDGTTTQRTTPVQVNGLTGIAAGAAGSSHTVAVKSDGSVWAWGANSSGQLGDGTTTQRTTPVQVSGLSGVVVVAGGGSHTVALKSDGTMWAWGANSSGQLGDGTITQRTTPVQVSGMTNVIAVSAGASHTTALKDNGTIHQWPLMSASTLWKTPVQVGGITDVTKVAVVGISDVNTVALKGDGTVWIWGIDTTVPFPGNKLPTPTQISGLAGVVGIGIGSSHIVILKDNGTVWAWGLNYSGELGDGTTTQRTTPVQASGLTGVAMAVAGLGYTVAVKNDGTVWAWGQNYFGELGDGTTNSRTTPGQVSGLTGITAVAGSMHTVALKNDGTVWAWGYNPSGQLGDGTTTSRTTPVRVSGLTGVTAVAVGFSDTAALKSDGTVWTWGDNAFGQLGDGTTTSRTTPVQVSGLTGVVAISASAGHTVALKNDGTVWAWGSNTSAQLGDGTTTSRTTPVQVSGLTGVVVVAAGGSHTIAVKSDGTVFAWGTNGSGQLGIWFLPNILGVPIRLTASSADTDQDGMPDAWEMQYFGNLSHTGGDDTDGDGLTDLQEFLKGTDPTKANSDGDLFTDIADPYPNDYYNNTTPTLTIVSGNNQTAAPGAFNSLPFDIGVWNPAGTQPLVNAPVTFTVQSGGGLLATANTGNPALNSTLVMFSDAYGTVQSYYKQPAGGGVSSQIKATAGLAQVTLSSVSNNVGLPNDWQLLYFGHTGVSGSADADGDGLTNAQEYAAGSNPVDYYNGRAFSLNALTTGGTTTTAYTYDSSGRLTLADFANGKTIQFTNSAASNLTNVTSSGIGGTITAWRTAYGLPADGTGSGADTAILANDGLPNLAKYAFGLNPNTTSTGNYPLVTVTSVSGSDYLTLTYSRPEPMAADLTYKVEVSADGTAWTSGTGATVSVSTTINSSMATVIVRDATTVGSSVLGRRIRLTIERRATP